MTNQTKPIGRPKRGAYLTTSITLSAPLLRRINEMAHTSNLSRSETVERLLRVGIIEAGEGWPENVIESER